MYRTTISSLWREIWELSLTLLYLKIYHWRRALNCKFTQSEQSTSLSKLVYCPLALIQLVIPIYLFIYEIYYGLWRDLGRPLPTLLHSTTSRGGVWRYAIETKNFLLFGLGNHGDFPLYTCLVQRIASSQFCLPQLGSCYIRLKLVTGESPNAF
jgi:hypothetical protein